MDKLGLPVEQFDDVITPAKRPSAEHISKMNRMAKIAMEGGSMEEIASLAPEEQFTANQMRNKKYFEKSLAEKYKAAENASIERGAKGLEKNLVSPTAEKYKAVLTEGEKKMARSILSGNIGKAAPYELSVLEKFIRPAGGAIAGAVEAIPPINKYLDKEPTASMAEAALSPEGSKGIARGVGAVAGMEAGAELGAMSPVLKGPATLAGAVGGSIAGAKLGEMLTGIPSVDKLIKSAYEKQLREREAKMVEKIKAYGK